MSRASMLVEAALEKDRSRVERLLSPSWFGLRKPVAADARHERLGITALMAAARAGDDGVVGLLLERGADVLARSTGGPKFPAGSTALHLAAAQKRPEPVAKLLAGGAEPDEKDPEGWTPLQLARKAGNRGAMGLLLERGADAFRGSPKGSESVMQWILQQGDTELLQRFAAHPPNLKAQDKKGNTALSMAVKNGAPELVSLLLDASLRADPGGVAVGPLLRQAADLAEKSKTKHGPVIDLLLERFPPRDPRSAGFALHIAVSLERNALAQAMLRQGAPPDGLEDRPRPPLVVAAERGDLELVRMLMEAGAALEVSDRLTGQTPLLAACAQGRLECARVLLDRGARLDATDQNGISALGWALSMKHVELAMHLLDRGAKPDLAAVGAGQKPRLVRAAEAGELELARVLLRCGADLESRESGFGWTPLLIAAAQGRLEVARFLVSAGANVQAQANQGLTPLHGAAQAGSVALVELLLDHGARLEATNHGGGTPLMDAAYHGRHEALRALAKRGADVDARNVHGMTPLMWAAERGHLEAVKALAELGADLDAQDREHGKTALMGAAATGNLAIVRALLDAGASTEVRDNQGDTVTSWIAAGGDAIRDALSRARSRPAATRSPKPKGAGPQADAAARPSSAPAGTTAMRQCIARQGLRPLGNRARLAQTEEQYDVRLCLFSQRERAARYLQALEAHAAGSPPPAAFEVSLVRIHTIWPQPFGLVLPSEASDARPALATWLLDALRKCNDTLRLEQSTDHSYAELHKYVKEVFDWTILVPAAFDFSATPPPEWLTDPPGAGWPALVATGS
jgi:ankyrin repeat protein